MAIPRREIDWQEFGELCKRLAVDVAHRGLPDAVVGIARGGTIVGTTLSFMLNLEFFPIRLAKQGGSTRVIVAPTKELADRSVLLVDDMSRTGDTFKIATYELQRVGAAAITTLALCKREPGFVPDLSALAVSAVDKVAFPWGREELVDGRFTLRKL